MSIPRNLGNFADNLTSTGTLNVGGINATGTPSASTALLGNGSWGTAGALVFISSQTVTSAVASVDFTSGISSTYDDYVVYFEDVTPTTTSVGIRLRLYKSGAFQTSNYSSAFASLRNTINSSSTNSGTYIYMGDNQIDTSQSVVSGTCTFFSMNSALGNRATAVGQLFFNALTASAQTTAAFGGSQSAAAATTGFQFYFSSGNINSGTFRLYGVAKA